MKNNKFLYTDGKGVVVTQTFLQTKKIDYRLKGITDFGLSVIEPKRLPGLLMLIAGAALILNAIGIFIPNLFFKSLFIPLKIEVEILIGAAVMMVGIAYLLIMRKRYAVRIETAEGDKNVVISKDKNYVDQILNAIRRAKLTSIKS